MFKVKNNGWISSNYPMTRGIRQGCPVSALIFILIAEMLATSLRQSNDIHGIQLNNNSHKIIQFADDATICVNNLDSVKNVLSKIHDFSIYAGPVINMSKTKGIWLGSLKDLGLRKFANIIWTGNPVKSLGIYIGHSKQKCDKLNWEKKIDNINSVFNRWSKRKLSIYGKVTVIKTYALSKIVFPATVLTVPDSIILKLKNIVYNFLWGKKDKIKRSVVKNKMEEGGLNMIDLDFFLTSLKAGWVKKILTLPGKWCDSLHMHLKEIGFDSNYIFKTTFRKSIQFPIIKQIPKFYQDVIISFNKCKTVKPFSLLNEHEIVQLPLWGTEYFKVKNTCLYLKKWIRNGIMYIKDLIGENGKIKNDEELITLETESDANIINAYIIKNYVVKKIKKYNLSIAPYVKIQMTNHILFQNKLYAIPACTSRFLYHMLNQKEKSRGNMESIYANNFGFENNKQLWQNIYKQKLNDICLPKIREFNLKLLHNILPCGYILNKWKENVNSYCSVCNSIETVQHMLFDCERIIEIWKKVSKLINMPINWKEIVCGYPKYKSNTTIVCYNYIVSIIAYSIFKINSKSKFESLNYKKIDIYQMVRNGFMYYDHMLKSINCEITKCAIYKKICDHLI